MVGGVLAGGGFDGGFLTGFFGLGVLPGVVFVRGVLPRGF